MPTNSTPPVPLHIRFNLPRRITCIVTPYCDDDYAAAVDCWCPLCMDTLRNYWDAIGIIAETATYHCDRCAYPLSGVATLDCGCTYMLCGECIEMIGEANLAPTEIFCSELPF